MQLVVAGAAVASVALMLTPPDAVAATSTTTRCSAG